MPRIIKDKDPDAVIRGTIKKYLDISGISTGELAASARMSRSTLNNRFRSPASFSLSELRAIQRKLGIDPEELFRHIF